MLHSSFSSSQESKCEKKTRTYFAGVSIHSWGEKKQMNPANRSRRRYIFFFFTYHQPAHCGPFAWDDETWTRVVFVSLGPVRHDLGLSVGFVVGLLGQVCGHGGRLHHGLEAALSLLDVLLRVEDDDVHLGDVEHAQGHGGAQAHGHRQCGGLDEHLRQKHGRSEQWPSTPTWLLQPDILSINSSQWLQLFIGVPLIIDSRHYAAWIKHTLCNLIACHKAVFMIFISKHRRLVFFFSSDEWFMTWYM